MAIEIIDGGDEAAMRAECDKCSAAVSPVVMQLMRDHGPQVLNGVLCDCVGDLTAFTLAAWTHIEKKRELTREEFTTFAARVTAEVVKVVAGELTRMGAFTQVTDCTQPPAGNN